MERLRRSGGCDDGKGETQQGDTIVVKVTNNLEEEELAIRWRKIEQVYIANHVETMLRRSCGRVFDEDRRSWIKLQIGTNSECGLGRRFNRAVHGGPVLRN